MVTEGVEWEVKQVLDSVTPGSPGYSEKSALAKTILKDGASWGDAGADSKALAHSNENMTCYACHSAWTTSCFGCHLSQTANQKKPNLHSEGGESRNWTSYNFQTLRDDIYFLARDGVVTKNRIAPARSACAVLVSSQNQNREWIYSQQQTVSAAGFAGTSFSTYVPHTVRTKETHGLHRLPRGQGGRQQRLDGRAAHAGHRLRELHRPLRLRGRGASRLRGRGGERARRAPGRPRLAAARARLSQGVRGPQGPRRKPHRGLSPSGRGGLAPAARRVPLRCPGQGRAQDLRRGPGRPQGLLRAHGLGPRLAPGPAALRRHQGRHLGGLAHDHDHRPGAEGRGGEPGAAGPPPLRLRLRDRPRGGPRGGGSAPRAARRQAHEQLRQAPGDLQRGRRARRGDVPDPGRHRGLRDHSHGGRGAGPRTTPSTPRCWLGSAPL